MRRFIKCGLSLSGVLCLMVGLAWAQESEPLDTAVSSTFYGVSEWNPFTFDENPVSSVRATSKGTHNLFGPFTCTGAATARYLGPAEPPAADVDGVCDPAAAYIWSYGSYDYSLAECRLDNTGQIFTYAIPGTAVSCVPFSCFGEPLITEDGTPISFPQIGGCTVTAFYTQTTMSEAGTGTFEIVEKFTYEQAEWDAARSRAMVRTTGMTTGTGTVTLNIPEEDLPARNVALEVPGPGSTMSGIGLISGWSCLGGQLAAEFRDANGVTASFPLSHGASRADTESICGDADNGFSTTMNWNLFGSGKKTIRLIQNGEAVASQTFSVVAFEEEFVTGASGMATVNEFPTTGRNVMLEWDESQQRFVITQIN